MKNIIFYTIIALLVFAIYGAFNLSLTDFQKKDVCPKVLGVPACYVVFLFFGMALLVHVMSNTFTSQWWYYGLVAIPFFLALSGTLTELSGKEICPRTTGGTPMCYISLGFCVVLILLKLIETKLP